ncbi:non-ribosomal peptide synthetase [Vallitalea maricola]|uniref:Uncharacterized protein n=1 Tax=Vallitalea maricola TaxID=3074433 RepID=A0ACB5UMN2_9FIRM|nr:hypothetical protein AN2V17_30350 [Vallitalea sp. AN17-2]
MSTQVTSIFNQKMYWREMAKIPTMETTILLDYKRSNIWSDNYDQVCLEINGEEYKRLCELVKESDLKLFITLTSIVTLVLHKHTMNKYIAVGIPTYPIRADKVPSILPVNIGIEEMDSFKTLLVNMRNLICGAYSNNELSFDEIMELFDITKETNRCPMIDVIVGLTNLHGEINIPHHKNDIGFIFHKCDNCVTLSLEYNASLYKKSTIENLKNHFKFALTTVMDNLENTIEKISLLSLNEKAKIFTFNNTQKNFSITVSTIRLFEQQVKANPNAIAVEHRGDTLTYYQLNQESNRLARLLYDLNVEKGQYVAILEERGINFLIAMLAVLKTGAAFVPIDSMYPKDRIDYVLNNSQVSKIITSSLFIQEIDINKSQLTTIICLDNPIDETLNLFIEQNHHITICKKDQYMCMPNDNLDVPISLSDPIYMMYTSGSTGLPKGAINRHDGVLNHIYAELDMINLHGPINFLQSAPTSTDISIWQFLTGILLGGQTTIIDYHDFCSINILLSFLEHRAITIMEVVPSFMNAMIHYLSQLPIEKRRLTNLKCLIVTGEVVSVDMINSWLKLFPDIPVANAYGPTEASDDITQYMIRKPLSDNMMRVPIGKPLANLNIYIFDSKMNLLPMGVPGEIGVSGIGVGNGYWENKTLTDKAFVPNCFAKERGDIIYKTGDIGRWLPDGNIEIIGRKDDQVKIRGYRIELDEIKCRLLEYEGISEVVLIAKENEKGDKYICAYIVANSNTQNTKINQQDIKKWLKDKLPIHMIPQHIIEVDKIPLLLNGKIDKKNLPEPVRNKKLIPPETNVQKKLISIWSSVLAIEEKYIGIDSNFFDLGGTSISTIEVKSRIKQKFSLDISIVDLFRYVSIRELATVMAQEDTPSSIITETILQDSVDTIDETLHLLEAIGDE